MNWREYDASLRQRGSLTIWFTDEAIEAWRAEPRTTRGGQPWHSPLAILTALTLRAVFGLALRQTEGLIGSVIYLSGFDLAVPDHSTLSRRATWCQNAPVVAQAARRLGCGHRPDRRRGADYERGRRWRRSRPFARPGRSIGGVVHRRRRVRPGGRCCRSRRAPSGSGDHRAAAVHGGAERDRRDRAHATRLPCAVHCRARTHIGRPSQALLQAVVAVAGGGLRDLDAHEPALAEQQPAPGWMLVQRVAERAGFHMQRRAKPLHQGFQTGSPDPDTSGRPTMPSRPTSPTSADRPSSKRAVIDTQPAFTKWTASTGASAA